MPDITQLDLDLIHCDADIQTRAVQENEQLALLCELYRDDGPEALPPVVVFHDAEGIYWLADGHYRVRAARETLSQEGPRTLPAEIHEGTKREAFLYAAEANAKHGQPLTAHEKRAVVQRLLNDPEWSQWSDRQIARHSGTSHTLVSTIRKQLTTAAASGNSCQMPATATRTVQRRGNIYPMHTGAIGRARGSQPTTPTTPASTATPQNANNGGLNPTVTKGLDELMRAWTRATRAARRTFRDWVLAHPVEDYEPIARSEPTQRYSAVIAAACQTASERSA